MKPCISEATTLRNTFAEDVNSYNDAGCTAMEVWLTKLEDHLNRHSAADTRKLLEDRQMTLAAASYQGGLLISEGEARRAHYDHFRSRLDLCQQFNIPTLLVVADFATTVDQAALERAAASLQQAAQWAAGFGVRLALEFRAKATFCSCLATALALVSQCGEANVGVNFDFFHYYTGPSKFEDLELLTPATLAFVQISDLAGVPRELATDADRVLPGDGDFQIQPILNRFRALGYQGWVSLELMNPTLWGTRPTHVADLGMRALDRMLRMV
jgi:4-hydroxyphenylpyruvate dioxygenase